MPVNFPRTAEDSLYAYMNNTEDIINSSHLYSSTKRPARSEACKIVFISTYPPRRCGIASFVQDLINALLPELSAEAEISVYALDKEENIQQYNTQVSAVTDSFQLHSWMDAANNINQDTSIQLLCFEHEFGLYGGHNGDYLLDFLKLIRQPFVIRFHTVLPNPDAERLQLVQQIGSLAEQVIVMTHHSAALLREEYHIPAQKITIIPHGTHQITTTDAVALKNKYHLGTRPVLTTFGLLSPNKGIETGIQAMITIVQQFPEARYLVLGRTHPNLLLSEGEAYREHLQQTIEQAGLTSHVKLINEYLPLEELMEYLVLTDIYLFTSRDPYQAMSGTFLYAMSAGCAIISNAFVLAHEMLDAATGVIIEPGNADQMARKAIALLTNNTVRKSMGQHAFQKTRNTLWNSVARRHIKLFSRILKKELGIARPLPVTAY